MVAINIYDHKVLIGMSLSLDFVLIWYWALVLNVSGLLFKRCTLLLPTKERLKFIFSKFSQVRKRTRESKNKNRILLCTQCCKMRIVTIKLTNYTIFIFSGVNHKKYVFIFKFCFALFHCVILTFDFCASNHFTSHQDFRLSFFTAAIPRFKSFLRCPFLF